MQENETLKPKKVFFEPVEVSAIGQTLLDWRNQQLQADKEVAAELIGEFIAMVL